MSRKHVIAPETYLSAVSPAQAFADDGVGFDVPKSLLTWLNNAQHMDGVPFSYLVPDPEALPPESLRFFHVDPTWQEALVDGALSVGLAGTDDEELYGDFRDAVRRALASLPGGADTPVSGMLLRSKLVRYYPQMEVRGFGPKTSGGGAERKSKTGKTLSLLPVVRRERLSRGVMLVLWMGVPARVELEEPREGTQFGVDAEGSTMNLEVRAENGDSIVRVRPGVFKERSQATSADLRVGEEVTVPLKHRPSAKSRGVLDIATLVDALKDVADEVPSSLLDDETGSADVSRHLQQTPFRWVFEGDGTRRDSSTVFVPWLEGLWKFEMLNKPFVVLED